MPSHSRHAFQNTDNYKPNIWESEGKDPRIEFLIQQTGGKSRDPVAVCPEHVLCWWVEVFRDGTPKAGQLL